jgi:hypothetical protein
MSAVEAVVEPRFDLASCRPLDLQTIPVAGLKATRDIDFP